MFAKNAAGFTRNGQGNAIIAKRGIVWLKKS